jgi:hypothetical protein
MINKLLCREVNLIPLRVFSELSMAGPKVRRLGPLPRAPFIKAPFVELFFNKAQKKIPKKFKASNNGKFKPTFK